jgi:hypothetical protein
MTRSATELVEAVRLELAPGNDDNLLVPRIAAGEVPLEVLAALAAEEELIVTSDWRSFLTLAAQSDDLDGRAFFTGLAQGEGLVLPLLADFAQACGPLEDYRPKPGCQAYPAYLAWLALNGQPLDALLAILVNFTAWGGYCATIAAALREHYGFSSEACAFFDFFATPVPEMEEQALAALQAGLDAGWEPDAAIGYGRLLQGYELMFWNTLAAS